VNDEDVERLVGLAYHKAQFSSNQSVFMNCFFFYISIEKLK